MANRVFIGDVSVTIPHIFVPTILKAKGQVNVYVDAASCPNSESSKLTAYSKRSVVVLMAKEGSKVIIVSDIRLDEMIALLWALNSVFQRYEDEGSWKGIGGTVCG